MARRPVSRAGRVLDLVGLALLLVGALCYLRAYAGMRTLEGVKPSPGAEAFASMKQWDRMHILSRTGLGLIGAGLVVAVGAAVAGGRRGKAESPAG